MMKTNRKEKNRHKKHRGDKGQGASETSGQYKKTQNQSIQRKPKLRKPKQSATQQRSVQRKKTLGKTKRRKSNQKARNRQKARLQTLGKEIGLTLLLFTLLFAGVQQLTFSLPKAQGYSMMPTILDGDRFFVNKWGRIRRFSLVYYRDPQTKETSIRRVVGLPKERLSYREDQLIINDREVVERFLEEAKAQAKENQTTLTEDFTLHSVIQQDAIPAEHYFLMGDNRTYASDSRELGVVSRKDIIGTVELRILPFHRLTRF